jgi:trimethylamine--corrinoid protein Co-methyltransferase
LKGVVRDTLLRIHRASCEVLHRTGVQIFNRAGLDLLEDAGAKVDETRVHFPPSLVEWALASTMGPFQLYKRGTDQPVLTLDNSRAYFGPGSDTLRYLDPRTGDRRPFSLMDVSDSIRVCDALSEIGFVMSVGVPTDVPEDRSYREQFALMLRNTTKPIVFVCDGLEDLEVISAMAAVVAGGEDALARFPNILLYTEPSTPLQHSREAVDKLLFCADHRIPVMSSPAPMMGGTAPVTVAGAVALGNAEALSGLVMHQLKAPGAPFLYGHGVHHMDMRDMISVYGAPEFQLARVLAAEMGRFYRLPVWGYAGHSDSKLPDAQAAADAQFSVLVALLACTNLNHDVGYLESGLTNSPEMMVLTDEIISMTRRFVEGIPINEETLALDVIDSVGPGGEFLSVDHTQDHWRELWTPSLFDRKRLDQWEAGGAKSMQARVKEAAVAILDDHQPEPLSDSITGELERLLR